MAARTDEATQTVVTQQSTPAEAASPQVAGPAMRRIPGIDGLRAVAVLLVLAFHLAPAAVPGGFVGVDVFFVISGFLITMGLLRERARTGRVDLVRFWVKRARRLLPALALVVLVCAPAAVLVGGDVRVDLDRQVFGAMTFSSNWVSIAADDSYFTALVPQLLANLWSLAVEEQFYLVWPFVVLGVLLLGRGRRAGLVVTGLAALASATAMALVHTPGTDPTRVYYGTDTHVFGMMLGALLAFWYFGPARASRPRPWPVAAEPLGRSARVLRALKRSRPGTIAGVCLLVVGVFSLVVPWDSALTYRGGLLLVSGAAAVLVTTMLHDSRLRRMLEHPVLRWVGERSYGLYLWHWPVFVLLTQIFAKQYVEGSGVPLVWVVTVVVTFALAAVSYRFVEQPVLRDGLLVSVERLARWAWPTGERAPGRVRGAVLAGTAAACVVLTGFAVATAPHVSSIEQQIAAGVSENGPGPTVAPPTAAPGDGASEDGDGAAADGDGTADGGSATPGVDGPTTAPGESPSGAPTAPSDAPTVTPAEDASQEPADETTEEPVRDGSDALVVGDSMMLASAKELRALLPEVSIDAEVSRSMLVAPDLLATRAAEGTLPDVVVLALATNTTLREPTVDDVLAAVGPDRRVVLVNAYGARSWIKGTNAVISRAAKEHPQVTVADWNRAVRDRGELLAADGIHPTREGAKLYARTIADAYEAASAR